jgi:hypothetical protein
MAPVEKPATEIARRLAAQAEAVCRRYLSNGHREGHYWLVGDASNTPGRSLYVRLSATRDGRGAAGKWTDAATGDHGDLLDIIAQVEGHLHMRDTLAEARRFLSLPPPEPVDDDIRARSRPAPIGSPLAAKRLFDASKPIASSVVEAYLRKRALTGFRNCAALRFHPRCYYRPSRDDAPDTRSAWPAMIAAVTDEGGALTGVHRTWLDPSASDKAPIASPRRAMGNLLGAGVRFGRAGGIMVAGEGIETILSLRMAMPDLPMIAGLSSAHLAAIEFPAAARRLYIARDNDPAGDAAAATLSERALSAGIEALPLRSHLGDFNDDLRQSGLGALRAVLREQLLPADAGSFLADTV